MTERGGRGAPLQPDTNDLFCHLNNIKCILIVIIKNRSLAIIKLFFTTSLALLSFFPHSPVTYSYWPHTCRLSTTVSSLHRAPCGMRRKIQLWKKVGIIFRHQQLQQVCGLNLAQLSLKLPKMMRMSLSRKPSSWPVSSSLKLWLRTTSTIRIYCSSLNIDTN